MRHSRRLPNVSLFPFLSVLLCIMGVLAFMSVSFLLLNETNLPQAQIEQIEFQWVGAPAFVKPIFIRCLADGIVYYDMFRNQEHQMSFRALVLEIQRQDGGLIRYLKHIVEENQRIKRKFGSTEYYPLLLVYPDGVVSAEWLMLLLSQVSGLNVGLEPMLPQWKVPYQSIEKK